MKDLFTEVEVSKAKRSLSFQESRHQTTHYWLHDTEGLVPKTKRWISLILYSRTKATSVGKFSTTKSNIIFTFTIPVMLICFINSNAMVTIYLNWPTNYLADQHPISLADDSAWTNSHAWTFGEIEWKPQTTEFLSNTTDMLAIP